MILLLDIGNTHTHLGLASPRRVVKRAEFPTADWRSHRAAGRLAGFVGRACLEGVSACSVVPAATVRARRWAARSVAAPWFELTAGSASPAIALHYPRPETVGPDRLSNAIAARHLHGSPCVAIDFGTAVTFDAVDARGAFIGGIIAPGISLLTDYLHERTALLPRIRLGPAPRAIGRSTEEAMRIAAVHGFAGMMRELIRRLKTELGRRALPVVATGGYARLMARQLPEITAVEPNLTLEGLRLAWNLKLAT